jgi:hypothetical protein
MTPPGNILVDDTASCSPNTHVPILSECYPRTEQDKEQTLWSCIRSHMSVPPAYNRTKLDEDILEAIASQCEFDSSRVPFGLAPVH